MGDGRGFTLIELLIVVVIIGILGAIAIPKFGATRQRAFFAAMKSDLKNLASAQEIYYSLNDYAFASALSVLAPEMTPSRDVTLTITNTTTDGWAATATHAGMAGLANNLCGYYYGAATAPTLSPALSPGVVGCNGGN